MPSVLAIISKKVFDKDCPAASMGVLYETSLYRSGHKVFDGLGGGDIYLVTARPGEKMWLVGVLRSPTKGPDGWCAQNETPVADITSLRATIKFESGKGISQKKGALGMSLQTPRALSANDVRLLEAALGRLAKPAKATPKLKPKPKPKFEPVVTSKPAETEKGQAEDVIQYTPEALEFLRPQSAADVARRRKKHGTLKAQWKKLSKNVAHVLPQPSLSGSLQSAAERALVLMTPEEPATLEGDDAAILIAGSNKRDGCCRYLVERIGLLDTLEALIRANDFPKPRGERSARFDADAEVPVFQDALFEAFLVADEETQDAYRGRVEQAYEEAGLGLRLSLVTCLRTRFDWGNACAQAFLEQDRIKYVWLLDMISDPSLGRRLFPADKAPLGEGIVNIIPGLREHAVPFLADSLALHVERPRYQQWNARALSCIGTPEAAEVFVAHLHKKYVRPYATSFFARNPHLAPAALGELAKKKTKLAGVARQILENLERVSTSSDAEVAADDEVPPILKNPPWHAAKRSKRKLITVPSLPIPASPAHLHWPKPLLRDWKVRHFATAGRRMTEEKLRSFEEKLARGKITFTANLPTERINKYLRLLPDALTVYEGEVNEALGFAGEAVLGAVMHAYQEKELRLDAETFMCIESPVLVPALLDRSTSRTHWLHYALKWIERYPEAACAGLVPLAVRKKSKARAIAEAWLRYLARRGHTKLVMAAAREHGEKCVGAVEEILAVDERQECPTKPPKMPHFFRPTELRAPKLRNGKALPSWAVERLGEMLKLSHTKLAYIGLGEVREACDATSLAEFSWDLAQAWHSNGAKDGQEWMLYAVLHFGDDDVVRRVTTVHHEAVGSMLGCIGSDAACAGLQTMIARITSGQQKKVDMYGHQPSESMHYIAACRGRSVHEMADLFLPALELDDERCIKLDLGTRKVWGSFDENLRPRLLDANRNAIRSLPSASKVDAVKHKVAKARWAEIQEEVETLVRYRGFALERAMVEERGWSPKEFRELWVTHPLLNQFARAVVWVAVDEEHLSIETFRITDDRSYADSRDEAWTLTGNVREIRVAHPGAWTKDIHEAWSTVFADYELHSPLAQLKRSAGGLTKEECSKTVLTRPRKEDTDVTTEALNNAGWFLKRHGYAHVHGFRDDTFVVLEVRPDHINMQGYQSRAPVPLGELSLVAQSEVHYVLGLLS